MPLLYPNVLWRVRGNELHAVRSRYALEHEGYALCGAEVSKSHAPSQAERKSLRSCGECFQQSRLVR